MLTGKLLAVALLSALGLSMSAAQAAPGSDHRDRGFQHSAQHGDFRHAKQARHHRQHSRHHSRHNSRQHDRGFR